MYTITPLFWYVNYQFVQKTANAQNVIKIEKNIVVIALLVNLKEH